MNRMKLLFGFLFTITLIISLSCSKEKKEQDEINYNEYKLIAWNSLLSEWQETVTHPWIDAEAIIAKNPGNQEDVIVVIFHTIYDALTCPITVYIDIQSKEVIYPENVIPCD